MGQAGKPTSKRGTPRARVGSSLSRGHSCPCRGNACPPRHIREPWPLSARVGTPRPLPGHRPRSGASGRSRDSPPRRSVPVEPIASTRRQRDRATAQRRTPAVPPSHGASRRPHACLGTSRDSGLRVPLAPGPGTGVASRARACSRPRSRGRARPTSGERVHEEARERLLELRAMAQDQMRVIEPALLRFERLNEQAGRRVDLVAGLPHRPQRISAGIVDQGSASSGKRLVLSFGYVRLDLAASRTGAGMAGMPAPVAVPPALAMVLRHGDDEERPAVSLQRPANDRLAVPAPRSVHERAPAPPAVAPLAMDDPPAASAELAVAADRFGPDLGDDLLGAAEGGPLFRGVGRDDARPTSPRMRGRRAETAAAARLSSHDSRAPFRDACVSRWTMRRRSAGSSGAEAPAGSRPNEPSSPSSENTGSNPVRASSSWLSASSRTATFHAAPIRAVPDAPRRPAREHGRAKGGVR